ncbi:MAG: wax ester/triacylglycerol synthase family O-acyltransferase [Deltaproteobacteria bacterium]|nr:wax ester/triacylglycerol synthase family O-acyltransferase [Deltaproteobacteria bacterium]
MKPGVERRLRQLFDGDAVFVSMETSEAPSQIAGLTVLDPSYSAEFGFDRFLEILDERLDLVPRFKWKLKEVPFGLDHAYWVEDPGFDVRRHVRRVALPAPRDRTALARLAGYLHAQPLDRTRPLWEAWWIEGLDEDRVAVLLKVHHCLMDGQSGVGLSEILMDLSPEPRSGLSPSEEEREAPLRDPQLWELGRRAIENTLRRQGRLAQHASRALRDGLSGLLDLGSAPPIPRTPRVSFNRRVSRHREFAFASLPLDPLQDARKHFDVKLNDVLLSIVASSLRRGLRAQNELPETSLVALCPVSLRKEGDVSFGNKITSMPVSLGTDIDDPVERLLAIHESAELAKQRVQQGAFEVITALGESLAPAAVKLLMRAAHSVSERFPLPGNLVFSNVRGLPHPTFMAGARVEEIYPMSMLQVANGMNVTAVSHDGQIDFGFLVDPTLVPEPWVYADGIYEALEELERAAQTVTRSALVLDSPAVDAEASERAAATPASESADPASATQGPSPAESEPIDLSLMMANLARRGGSQKRR